MFPMQLLIKNMVCQRCIAAVERVLKDQQLSPQKITLGEVTLKELLDEDQKELLAANLENLGFELVDDKKTQVIVRIKSLIIDQIHHKHHTPKTNWSDFLADSLNIDYKTLSRLFSSIEGITIEHYIIRQKVERVKELIIYDQLRLSEIAYQLDYSSVAHLSAQFKKTTGMTPSEFKQIGGRTSLDKL